MKRIVSFPGMRRPATACVRNPPCIDPTVGMTNCAGISMSRKFLRNFDPSSLREGMPSIGPYVAGMREFLRAPISPSMAIGCGERPGLPTSIRRNRTLSFFSASLTTATIWRMSARSGSICWCERIESMVSRSNRISRSENSVIVASLYRTSERNGPIFRGC